MYYILDAISYNYILYTIYFAPFTIYYILYITNYVLYTISCDLDTAIYTF